MKKVLVLNISTDSENTSLGFAISWLNAFAKKFDEVHVISLSKGSDDELEKNVTVYSVDNELGRISKIINLYKLINKLTKSNKYEFCLSHMSSLMVIISSPILKMRKIKSIFWYTHKGPTDFLKKIFLLKASIYSNRIITASKNSFPYKRFFNNKRKLHVIGHAIKFDDFFRKINSFDEKDFVIISRISKSKKIDESISGFLNSEKGSSHKLSVIGGPLSSEDEIYYQNLKLKYASHENISFLGSMPHKNLINEISDFSFHINNTEEGFYDKSVLETMSHGLVNFYSNSDYDDLLPEEYRDKFKFDGTWYNSLIGDLVIRTHFEFGFLGTYNQSVGLPPFERFFVGGDGLSGYSIDGREIIALRGYPNGSLSSDSGDALYNKYNLELRYPISLNPNSTIYGLLFTEAGNSWTNYDNFNPFELKRSAGLGLRIFMPMFGLLGLDFAHGFDNLSNSNIKSGWQTHFIIGQQF